MTGLPIVPFLNDDVLGYIFHLNTSTPELEGGFAHARVREVSALDIARHTSQVCRSWRELMLGSPTIWANIIDLEILNSASSEWVMEVIKRTGDINLSIYGSVGYTCRSRWTIQFLLGDLRVWYRVGRLDINIKEAWSAHDFWSIFWRWPAPNLEKFVVTGLTHDRSIRSSGRMTYVSQLFAGSAPSLRRFHCLPSVHFDCSAAWVSQLCSLTLSAPFTIFDALNVITVTPHLESLVIERTVDDDDEATSWNREIHLPNLRRLFVSSDVMGSQIYLSNIVPSADCALILTIRDELHNLNDADNLQALSGVILPYAKRYFDAHLPTNLVINIEDLNLRFTYKTATEGVYFGHPEFSLNLRSKSQYRTFAPGVVDSLLSTLSSATSNCNTITSLRFALTHSLWFTQLDKPLHIFRSLTSIKTIAVTPWALHALDDPVPLFPDLTEVTIPHRDRNQHFNFEKRLVRFLTRRKDAGIPLQVLNIAYYSPFYNVDRSVFLKEFEGLEVIYEHPDSGQQESNTGTAFLQK